MTLQQHIETIWSNCKVEILPNNHIKVIRPNGDVDYSAGPLAKYIKWSMVNVHNLKISEDD